MRACVLLVLQLILILLRIRAEENPTPWKEFAAWFTSLFSLMFCASPPFVLFILVLGLIVLIQAVLLAFCIRGFGGLSL